MKKYNCGQAIKILKIIQDNFFDCYYPLKHVMYDKKRTVGEVYAICITILEKEIK